MKVTRAASMDPPTPIRAHRRYTRRQKATAIIAAEMSSVQAAAESTGIPRTTLMDWFDEPWAVELRQKTREQNAELVGLVAQLAWHELAKRVQRGEIDSRDLVVLAGVATDKAQLLTGHATERTESRDITETLSPEAMDALADDIDSWLKARRVDAV